MADVSPLLVDTQPPEAPAVEALTTSDTTPTITGTATLQAGESLSVTVNGATYNNVTVTAGNWSIDTGTAQPVSGTLGAFVNGQSYEVSATVTDTAGHIANDIGINEIVVVPWGILDIRLTGATKSAAGGSDIVIDTNDEVTVEVQMSDVVNISGTTNPTIQLNVGGVSRTATYTGGSGTDTLSFTYTIQGIDFDHNGISVDANSFSLNGATIEDTSGNLLSPTHGSVAEDTDYRIDSIDLGEGNGLLIRGAQAEGNWYFGWDANADGIWNGSTMDDYSIFSTGTQFHGQTISGVTLMAPVLGVEPPTAGANPGTNISDGLTDNPTYDGLLAIWDAHNGSTTASNEGLPAQWIRDRFWSRSEDAVTGGSHYFVLNPLDGTAYSIDTSLGGMAASVYQVI